MSHAVSFCSIHSGICCTIVTSRSPLAQGAPSLAAFLPQELSHESGAGEHDPNRPVASAEAADRASEFVEGTYIVNGTRGGGIPVEIEKRSKGKKVRLGHFVLGATCHQNLTPGRKETSQ